MRWLTVDPGDSTGWSIWNDRELVAAGTIPMWDFADLLWEDFSDPSLRGTGLSDECYLREGYDLSVHDGPIERIVCEDFRIYPWLARKGHLNWDSMRTPRLIGAITLICRIYGAKLVFQPAKIKERAVQGGAEELFYTPLHENRHHNDAIMHGVFYLQEGGGSGS